MSFMSRMQSGEKVTDLCKEFGISRKTAYKFIGRYEKHGPTVSAVVRRKIEKQPTTND